MLRQVAPTTQPIHGHDGRRLGHVTGAVFYKNPVRRSAHFYKRSNGWGCDAAALAQAVQAGATRIELMDTDTGVTYEANIILFRAYGVDVDYGAQIVLPLRYWRTPELQPALFAVGG